MDVEFGLSEIVHGFFSGAGGPERLARMIPRPMAMDMILTGDPIDAETALRSGLVSRLDPARRSYGHRPPDREPDRGAQSASRDGGARGRELYRRDEPTARAAHRKRSPLDRRAD